MNTTAARLARRIRNAALGLASLFVAAAATSSALSEEAYLGVGGFITRVSVEPIISTTSEIRTNCQFSESTKGFQVREIEFDSPADLAGLRRGDVLIEAEGIALSSYSSLARMRRALADLGSVEVFYLRNGQLRSTFVGGDGGGTITTTTVKDRR